MSWSDGEFGLYSAFQGSLAVVNEPRGGELSTYVLTVQRTHGTFGVVEVSWFASIAGNVSFRVFFCTQLHIGTINI